MGPIVVHVDGCPGAGPGFPPFLEDRDQVVRVFGEDAGRRHTQVYDLNRLVRAGDGLQATVSAIFQDPRMEFVHLRNVLSQCYNATVVRA